MERKRESDKPFSINNLLAAITIVAFSSIGTAIIWQMNNIMGEMDKINTKIDAFILLAHEAKTDAQINASLINGMDKRLTEHVRNDRIHQHNGH